MIEKVDFSKTEICTETYIGDEAVEILGRFFLGISPDLPILINKGKILCLYEIGVYKRSDGKYKIDVYADTELNEFPLIEKNPESEEYVLFLKGEPYVKNPNSI
jgi:hypothetical protein